MSLKQESPTDFLDFINYVATFYGLHGDIPSEDIASDYGVPNDLYKKAFADEDFRDALEERGIILTRYIGEDKDNWQNKGLTEIQLMLANQLLDLADQRTNKKKMQDLGVSTNQYSNWLKDPAFSKYLHTRAEQLFGEHKHETTLALLDNIRRGDLKSIMYHNEMLGIYTPQRAGVNQVDVHGLIVNIIEIIDDEIEDGDTKFIIGERLKQLISANNTAHALVQSISPVGTAVSTDGIEQPEVVATRKIDIKELATKETLL